MSTADTRAVAFDLLFVSVEMDHTRFALDEMNVLKQTLNVFEFG